MTVVERAARALCVELHRQDTDREIAPEAVRFDLGLELSYIDQTSVDCGALVRAVLQAVRDMDEPILDRAFVAAMVASKEIAYEGPEMSLLWQAMIDAALAE